MNDDDIKTNILPDLDAAMKAQLKSHSAQPVGTGSLTDKHEILLLIGDATERIYLAEDMHCLLGRFAKTRLQDTGIDLTPYDATEMGISRIHARLHVENNRLFIADLDSTNGTFVGGVKLQPHKPTEIRNGTQLVLGRLEMQIMFQ